MLGSVSWAERHGARARAADVALPVAVDALLALSQGDSGAALAPVADQLIGGARRPRQRARGRTTGARDRPRQALPRCRARPAVRAAWRARAHALRVGAAPATGERTHGSLCQCTEGRWAAGRRDGARRRRKRELPSGAPAGGRGAPSVRGARRPPVAPVLAIGATARARRALGGNGCRTEGACAAVGRGRRGGRAGEREEGEGSGEPELHGCSVRCFARHLHFGRMASCIAEHASGSCALPSGVPASIFSRARADSNTGSSPAISMGRSRSRHAA